MGAQWFYSQNSQQQGPVSADEIKQLAAAGKLLPTDMLWKEGLKEWVPASRIEGLFPPLANKIVPPPLPAQVVAEVISNSASEIKTQGLGRFIPEKWLTIASKPLVAIGAMVGIFIFSFLLGDTLTRAMVFGCAFLIYFDASSNKIGKIGKILPRRWFSANMSAGMWAIMAVILWFWFWPLYFIKRPSLIEKAKTSPQEASGTTWKLAVLGVLAAMFLLAGIGEIVTGRSIGSHRMTKAQLEASVLEDLQKEYHLPFSRLLLAKEADNKYTGIATAISGLTVHVTIMIDDSDGSYVYHFRRQ